MRKCMMTFSLLLFISPFISSQKNNASPEKVTNGQMSFFAEGGGPGIAFSANIDRRFKSERLGWGGRIGIGFVSAYDDSYGNGGYYSGVQRSALTLPVQVNYIFGKPNSAHTFEVGAGATWVSLKLSIMNFYLDVGADRRSNFFGTFCFMYRRQPINGGFSWRIGFTPLFAKSYIQPFGAVSVGYNF